MNINIDQKMKKNIVSFIFAITCLGLYFLFPIEDNRFEIFVGTFIFILILPILYIKLVLKKTYADIGFQSLTVNLRDILFMLMAIILGGLLSFVIVSVGWGTQEYAEALSRVVFIDFKAFALYEILFSSTMLFLFTFFSWGFVYSIKCKNEIYTYFAALATFTLFLISFYTNIWIVIPMLIPAFFVPQIRDKKNIVYIFGVIFMINLIMDTLIIKSFS